MIILMKWVPGMAFAFDDLNSYIAEDWWLLSWRHWLSLSDISDTNWPGRVMAFYFAMSLNYY